MTALGHYLAGLFDAFGLGDVAAWLGQTPIALPSLAQPLWLLILLPPLGLLLWHRWQRQRLIRYADPGLSPWAMTRLSRNQSPRRRQSTLWLLGLFWLLLALGLADPRVPKADGAAMQVQPPILFVVDDSAAMSVQDVSPDRLSRSVQLIRLLLPQLGQRRLGLMVYADQAGLLLPPSTDPDLLRYFLEQIPSLAHPVVAPQPDQAFDVAAELSDLKGGVIVWLTSADQVSFVGAAGSQQLAAAERLKRRGLPLFAITEAGAGGPLMADGQPIKDREANPIISRPAPKRVEELAKLTGGDAATTSTLPADAAFLLDRIRQLPDLPPQGRASDQTRSLHALPLLLAVLSLIGAGLLGLPRTSGRATGSTVPSLLALTAALILGSSLPPSAQAADGAATLSRQDNRQQLAQGNQAMAQGDFARAQVLLSGAKGFPARLGTGIAAYRRADYPFAVTQFQMALWQAQAPAERALALFNLGDALVMTGRYDAAFDAFSAVLAIQPDNENAKKNRELVDKFREKITKNAQDSPKFKGYQAATYGFYHEPKTGKMDKEIQQSSGGVNGAGAATPQATKPTAPFALTEAIGASARKKLDLVNDQPAPLLDGLLRQQPYHAPDPGSTP